MIRTFIAALLLKSLGHEFEYRVQRNKKNAGKDGTTYLRTRKLRDAKAKFDKMRAAYNDTVTIRLVATVASREVDHGVE